MATVILSHQVKDFDGWKKGFDTDSERRSSAGMTQLAVGKKAGTPDTAYVVFDVPDPAVIEGMMADEGLKAAMQAAGVISTPELIILE